MRSEFARDLGMTSVMGMRFCSLRSILEWRDTARTTSALTPRAISGEPIYEKLICQFYVHRPFSPVSH
jgi:hypothetical protein